MMARRYGAACTWQIDDPTVTLVQSTPRTDLASDPYGYALFTLPHAGTCNATCTIGTAKLPVKMTR